MVSVSHNYNVRVTYKTAIIVIIFKRKEVAFCLIVRPYQLNNNDLQFYTVQ